MLKKIAILLLLCLTACNLPNPYLPTLPPTLAPEPSQTPTESITVSIPPTPTLTVSPTNTETVLPPTQTAIPTATQVVVKASATYTLVIPFVTLTNTPPPAMTFQVQAGTPVLTKNFAHPVEACRWSAVAGQVFDASGNVVLNLVVHVSGTLDGKPVDQISLTGVALDYGPGGYEVKLADLATASSGTLTIQLLDLQAHPLSEAVLFNTSADCQKNVTLINFVSQ